jgi:HD-like signal output (HDOD) protein
MTATATTATEDLKSMLSTAQLPSLPQSAIRLLQLSKDPENGPAEFAVPIEADPGLASQVLRFVNSSYFGFSREIATVKHAITLVGIRTIKNFSLWSAVFSLMPNPRCGSLDLKKLWQDSLRRAIFAREFGKAIGIRDEEEGFAASLLQDMAIPLLAKDLGPRYADLFDLREGGTRRLSHLEEERFGWTHSQAATMIADRWNLPTEFTRLVEGHADTEFLHSGQAKKDQRVVGLAALLPASIDEAWPELSEFVEMFESLSGSDGPTIKQALTQVDEAFKEFAPLLEISAPSHTLVAFYESETEA